MPTFFHKTGREAQRVRRENSQRPGPLPLGKAQQKPRKQQEPSGLPEGSLPPIWNLRQLRRAKNRQIIQCVGGFHVGHSAADSGNPGKADEVPKRNGRHFVESDEKQNRCNRMVEPAGNHARGTKTTDGRTGPAGKFSCCFWASAGKLAGKQNGFPEKNREKPDGTTGNPTGRSQRGHGGSMGKSARGIVRKNKRPPLTAQHREQGPDPRRQTGEQEGISGNMNQFLFSARQW